MKRWTFRIVLCLLLVAPGAVTSVAVALGLAVTVDVNRHQGRYSEFDLAIASAFSQSSCPSVWPRRFSLSHRNAVNQQYCSSLPILDK